MAVTSENDMGVEEEDFRSWSCFGTVPSHCRRTNLPSHWKTDGGDLGDSDGRFDNKIACNSIMNARDAQSHFVSLPSSLSQYQHLSKYEFYVDGENRFA